MEIYDLCTVFSNAIQNGIEACEKMHGVEKVVNVSILEHQNSVLLQFSNPATSEMYSAVKHGKTTKVDNKNHGFGVENIRTTVERNKGTITYIFKEDKLILEIYFERK